MHENQISQTIMGAAIDVHRELGLGLLESIHEECLAYELKLRKIPFERQKAIPLIYKQTNLNTELRLDFLVCQKVIVELKAVDHLHSIYQAQVMTYLRLTGCKLGLLINFNVPQLIKRVRRIAFNLPDLADIEDDL
ncbi:MAG: GxxExxY protein [Chloroflexota bacterium]|nr:GxxExxY protein [Chloroflexota bacterium]